MGDHYQSLSFVDVTAEQAPAIADSAIAHLVGRGIVAAERTHCVLSNDTGHAPGPHYALALANTEDAANDDLRELSACGVGVDLERHVAVGWNDSVTCPHCGWSDPLEEPDGEMRPIWERVSDALSDWWDGGSGEMPCPSCGKAVRLNDWQGDFQATWAVSHLTLTFWNWPLLAEAFVEDLGRTLAYRVRHTGRKL